MYDSYGHVKLGRYQRAVSKPVSIDSTKVRSRVTVRYPPYNCRTTTSIKAHNKRLSTRTQLSVTSSQFFFPIPICYNHPQTANPNPLSCDTKSPPQLTRPIDASLPLRSSLTHLADSRLLQTCTTPLSPTTRVPS